MHKILDLGQPGVAIQQKLATYPDRLQEALETCLRTPDSSTLNAYRNNPEDFQAQLRPYELQLRLSKKSLERLKKELEKDIKALNSIIEKLETDPKNTPDNRVLAARLSSLCQTHISADQVRLAINQALGRINAQLDTSKVAKTALKLPFSKP